MVEPSSTTMMTRLRARISAVREKLKEKDFEPLNTRDLSVNVTVLFGQVVELRVAVGRNKIVVRLRKTYKSESELSRVMFLMFFVDKVASIEAYKDVSLYASKGSKTKVFLASQRFG